MGSLGFTFYPKDWWTSDSFYTLQPFERYIYLECIFMMYVNDGWVADNKLNVERRLGATIKDEVWCKITDLFVKDGDKLTHKSVNARLKKTVANRENGKKGGAPKGNNNASRSTDKNNLKTTKKQPKQEVVLKNEILVDFISDCISGKKQPKQPNITTQNNPPLEREIESEIENNTPSSYYEKSDNKKNNSISTFGKQPIEILKLKFFNVQSWFEQIGMKNSILPDEIPLWFEKFCTHCQAQGKEEMTEKDFRSYFANWVTKQRNLGIPLIENFSEGKSKKVNLRTAFQNSIIKQHGK